MARYKRLPLDKLVVDERYQRPLDHKRVKRITEDFDERKLGVLEVSERNGRAAVFDGQHRLAVLRLRGEADAPCLAHENLTPEEEAELFVGIQNDRRGILPVDKFKARVFSGEQRAVLINKAVTEAGFEIYQGSSETLGRRKQISAIGAVDRIYGRYGVLGLTETLSFIADLWEGDKDSTHGLFLLGVASFIAGYGHRITDVERDKLRAVAPVVLIRRATADAHTSGGSGYGDKIPTRIVAEMRKITGLRGTPRRMPMLRDLEQLLEHAEEGNGNGATSASEASGSEEGIHRVEMSTLKRSHYRILAALYDGPKAQGDIWTNTGLGSGTTSQGVRILERDGFIVRQGEKVLRGRSSVVWMLTDKGHEELQKADPRTGHPIAA
jgi:DNA-binding MarR family transcriptional regulator